MKYGQELVEELRKELAHYQENLRDRSQRINDGLTDMDDCFVSQHFDEQGMQVCKDKIELLERDGGYAWFPEYATLDGTLVKAHWCRTNFGYTLRAEMPDGSVVWTKADTAKGLAKKGLKKVLCKRAAWFCLKSGGGSGMMGAMACYYDIFPSDINFATGEFAVKEPLEIKDLEGGD